MTCEHIRLANGTGMFVCGTKPRAKCSSCGNRADLECDWKVAGNKSGTCDKPICARCTTSPAPGKDLCPEHAAAWANWQQEQRA